ncbi:MAG: penicillin acylase family protein [Balneolia bacterium]|nr:penicillin acylase family protein [Balneolia bacterium]
MGILFFVALAFLIIRSSLFTGPAAETGQLQTTAVTAQTHIDRTADGHVTVSSSTIRNIIAGVGFAHARDRLWQMQRFHWAANSTFSSLFGERFLEADKLAAVLLHTGDEELKDFFGVSNYDYELLGYYADGVNSFIREAGRNYPVQFTVTGTRPSPWTADDVLRVLVLQSWLLNTDWQLELANSMVAASLPETLHPYLFDGDMREIIRQTNLPEQLFPQVRTLLSADARLRELLNAPAHIEPVRSVSQRYADGTIVHFSSLQSGNQAPVFWYDVSISNQANQPLTGFTVPGSPVVWAGSTSGLSWVPEFTVDHSRLIIQADSIQHTARILIDDKDGGRQLYRLALTQGGFLAHVDSEPEFLFNRFHPNVSELLGSFRRAAFDGVIDANVNSGLRPKSINISETDSSLTTGFTTDISDFLNSRLIFDSSRLLALSDEPGHEMHPGRIELAEQLSFILAELPSVADLNVTREYLNNWNGQYERHAVAASIMELSLRKIAENALSNYLEEDDYRLIERLGLIDQEIGTQLIRAHHTALLRNGGGVSPVTNAFFGRRVQEALNELRATAGPETFDWRWSNVNKNTFSDKLICGNASAQSRSRACIRLETARDIPVLGQQDLLNTARLYSDGNRIRTQSLTTAVLQTIRRPGQPHQTVSIVMPGTSADPFSEFYSNGLDSWPPFGPVVRTAQAGRQSRITLTP